MNMRPRGLTLVEVLVAILIITIAAGTLVTIYPGIFVGLNIERHSLRALEIARRQIEVLKGANFTTLWGVSYTPPQAPIISTFPTGVVNTTGFFYVQRMLNNAGAVLPDLVRVEVLVCYRSDQRVVGEDANLNGLLDAGEDTNLDGIMSSPVSLVTLVMR